MRITGIATGEIQIPLARPFKTALRTVERVEDIVVRVTAENGIVGYGEAPPTAVITGDTKGSVLAAIHQHIAPAITGMDILCLDEVIERMAGSIKGNTSAKAAVDMALWDLYGQLYKIPVYKLLGGARKEIITDITISVNPPEEMARDAVNAVERGYDTLKIKVGRRKGWLPHPEGEGGEGGPLRPPPHRRHPGGGGSGYRHPGGRQPGLDGEGRHPGHHRHGG